VRGGRAKTSDLLVEPVAYQAQLGTFCGDFDCSGEDFGDSSVDAWIRSWYGARPLTRGRHIAFVHIDTQGQRRLMTLPSEDGLARQLTQSAATTWGTAWSKKSKHVLFVKVGPEGQDSQIATIPFEGGNPEPWHQHENEPFRTSSGKQTDSLSGVNYACLKGTLDRCGRADDPELGRWPGPWRRCSWVPFTFISFILIALASFISFAVLAEQHRRARCPSRKLVSPGHHAEIVSENIRSASAKRPQRP
jgi:hypothetical protein